MMSLGKVLHKLTSPVLYKTGLYERGWRARSRAKPFSFVVVYHRVVAARAVGCPGFDIERGIPASVFERQMRFLLRHFSAVKASRIQHNLGREIQFAVTLDDGYEDNYLVAAPILKKLGIPATFYVVSDFVGSDRLFWWEQVAAMMRATAGTELDLARILLDSNRIDEVARVLPIRTEQDLSQAYETLCSCIRKGRHADIPSQLKHLAEYLDVEIPEQGRPYRLMNWDQLNELVRQGFDIGGHTASHCNVVGTDVSLLQRELIESVNTIEAKLDTPVESFAYPYGVFEPSSKPVAKLLAMTNCKVAFTTVKGVIDKDSPANELARTKLNRAYDFACAFNVQETLNHGNGSS
jgi:peptidoglycan/xylan/chitin deacetylase (PgdA/CDA1 family)